MNGPIRRLRYADWLAIAKQLFGPDPMQWRFRCVSCGHVQTAAGLVERRGLDRDRALAVVVQECEGRYAGATSWDKGPEGCDWALYGLLQIAEVFVVMDSGKDVASFAFDHPDAPALVAAAAEKLASERAAEAGGVV